MKSGREKLVERLVGRGREEALFSERVVWKGMLEKKAGCLEIEGLGGKRRLEGGRCLKGERHGERKSCLERWGENCWEGERASCRPGGMCCDKF